MECKSIGCTSTSAVGDDFCVVCLGGNRGGAAPLAVNPVRAQQNVAGQAGAARSVKKTDSSGGDNDYWTLEIKYPKRLEPYTAECEDIIESLGMSFQEGEAFKAIWRKAGLRAGNGKPGDSALRNAEKVAHFGSRMVAIETRQLQEA